jgi:predicted PurR-regulated permease PerM
VLLIFGFMLSAAIALPRVSRAGLDSQQQAVQRVSQFTEDIRQYVTVMTLVNFLVGLGNTILLWIVGVPYAVLWGLLAWFLGYIPSVGFWLALIPPVILAYVEQGAGTALFVFLAYVLINGGVQNLVQPRLMGQSLNISPLVVFISVFVWAWLLGGIGAILAVPLTLLILEVLNSFDSSRWLVTLMRYAPGEQSEDREHAQDRLKDLWQRMQTRVRNLEGGDAQLDQDEPA